MFSKLLFIAITLPLLVTATTAGEVFSWVDESGRVNYSDTPPEHGYASVVDLTEKPVTTVGNSGLRTEEKALLQNLEERQQLEMKTRMELAARPQAQPAPPAPVYEPDEYYPISRRYYYPIYRPYKRHYYKKHRPRHQHQHQHRLAKSRDHLVRPDRRLTSGALPQSSPGSGLSIRSSFKY